MTENERNENDILTGIYDSTVNAMKVADTEQWYNSLATTFTSLKDFRDSERLAAECLERAEQLRKKRLEKEEADRLNDNQIAEEKRISDERTKKKNKILISIGAPMLCALIAFVIVLNLVIIPRRQYKEAVEKYSDTFNNASVGDIVKFGLYEQDNNFSNGKEEIEWIVLAKDEDNILLISRYALDCISYGKLFNDRATWEKCSLRKWLNRTFINSAFSKGEQRLIKSTTVTADKNPMYRIYPGNDTTDKVFLLSITEANNYFSSDAARRCIATSYAQARDADITNGRCCWWLRSPGADSDKAATVDSYGYVDYSGSRQTSLFIGENTVRPALWVSLK